MKEISIKIDDSLYGRARQQLENVESSVAEYVKDYLQSLCDDGERIAAARVRMDELFRATTGFGVGAKPSREEMHERGSVH